MLRDLKYRVTLREINLCKRFHEIAIRLIVG
jgi:hypothetical protein